MEMLLFMVVLTTIIKLIFYAHYRGYMKGYGCGYEAGKLDTNHYSLEVIRVKNEQIKQLMNEKKLKRRG